MQCSCFYPLFILCLMLLKYRASPQMFHQSPVIYHIKQLCKCVWSIRGSQFTCLTSENSRCALGWESDTKRLTWFFIVCRLF